MEDAPPARSERSGPDVVFAESVSVALLGVVLVWAVVRPWGWPEAIVAVPAAGLLITIGAITPAAAWAETRRLAPVVGFLAAVLVLAHLCAAEGLFRACGAWMARAADGRSRRLLIVVFLAAASITAVLSLDATVVLLTPVVFATAARLGVPAKPYIYASTHLSNSASLLLPISNLTNLLALAATGLTFTRFAALMVLPWLAVITVEYLVFRWFFYTDLTAASPPAASAAPAAVPVFALVTVVATLAGFIATDAVGLNLAWAAAAGALTLAVRGLRRRTASSASIGRAAALPFLAFVLALGVVVAVVVNHGLGEGLSHLLPTGVSLWALLGIAGLAAALANVINNLPAVLVLLPLAAPAGTGPVLAVLLGVNIGPNLTYTGSLATLLWRRIVHRHDHTVDLAEFTRLGVYTVPTGLLAATVALWVSLHLSGG